MGSFLDRLYANSRGIKFLYSGYLLLKLPFLLSKSKPNTDVDKNGFKTFEGFMPDEECARIIEDFDHYFQEALPSEDSDAYIVSRQDTPDGKYDKNVFQLMNYHHLNWALQEQYEEKILSLVEDELGLDLCIASYTVQLDLPDSRTKRPYHTDGYQVNYKLFIYLNDVLATENGPYTVIPGSHKQHFKKWRNFFSNLFSGNPSPDDMLQGFSDKDATPITAPAGTAILSCQALAHKGWQGHTDPRRYVLIIYLRAKKRAGERFVLGRNMAISEPKHLYEPTPKPNMELYS